MGIEVRGVSKHSGTHAVVDSVSFTIDEGDFAVILGPTGAGKTTLLRVLAGVERADAGVILYDGVDVTRTTVRQRPVAMVYQNFVNYPSLTVYENIASPVRQQRPRVAKDVLDRRVRETAEMLGLSRVLTHLPAEISGGQQQRCAIARALAKGAKYMFLDEPLANLDFKLREELRSELKQVFQETGGAVIYATPDPIDALSMASHAGVMRDGKLLQYGPARGVFDAPASVAVAEYFSYPAMNVLNASVEATSGIRISDSLCIDVPAPDREAVSVGIRPHAVSLHASNKDALPFDATVAFSEVVGSDTELAVEHSGQQWTVLIDHVRRFETGDSIRLFLNTDDLLLFDADSGALIGKTN